MARTVFLSDTLSHLAEIVLRLGHRVTPILAEADLLVAARSVPDLTGDQEILQFGGAVPGDLPDGRYVTAPVTARHWRITPAADLLGLRALAHATLLTDPPRAGLHWTGRAPAPEPAYATPLVTTRSGHHAAALFHRPHGGNHWWVTEQTLDPAPWVEAVLEHPLRPSLHGYDIE